MKKLTTAVCVALLALSGTAAHAADEKKDPTKQVSAKTGDKAASAAPAASAASGAAKKKEKKGGC